MKEQDRLIWFSTEKMAVEKGYPRKNKPTQNELKKWLETEKGLKLDIVKSETILFEYYFVINNSEPSRTYRSYFDAFESGLMECLYKIN